MSGLPLIEQRHLLDPLDPLFARLPALADVPEPSLSTDPRDQKATRMNPDTRALIEALHDALNLPHAETADGIQFRARLIDQRATDAKVILASVLNAAAPDLASAAAKLRSWTSEYPVDYCAWQDPRARAEGETR
jgi:hypothetical protein